MRGLRSSCGLLLAAVALAQTPPENASVTGTVTHSITGAPVLRAHVMLRGSGPNAKIYGALTTAEGKFSITGVVPGTYQATADRLGFFFPAGPGGRTTVEVALRAGEKKDDVKFQLAPMGAVLGRVLDADGEPVEGAAVTLESAANRMTADDKGRFRLGGVRPGRYRVKAVPPSDLPSPPEIRTDGTVEVHYAPTYYPGVPDARSATRLEVGTGAELSGVEIRLVRTPMVRVSGKVVGVPPETLGVSLMFSQPMTSRGMSGVRKDGTFAIWNIEPGKYSLSARWSSGNQAVQTAPVDIEVGQANVDNIELRVVPPSDLSGQVVFEDEQARPQAPAQGQPGQTANARPPRLELRPLTSGVSPSAAVAADGSFRLAGVQAGRYRVAPSWTPAYVKSITLGSNQVAGNILDLRGGAGGAALSLLVSSALGSLSGAASDENGPVGGARIVMVPDDFESRGDVVTGVTDPAGSYTFGNLRPGRYRVAVADENDSSALSGDLADYEDVLAAVEIRARDKVVKDLKRHAAVK